MGRPKGLLQTEETKRKMRVAQNRRRNSRLLCVEVEMGGIIVPSIVPVVVQNNGGDGDCRRCGHPLLNLKWDRAGDILICQNDKCELWHVPQGFSKKLEE